MKPPLVPPRGEVNAADAFDIGSFDEDDVKGVKLSESDQEIYSAFNHVNSERWQQEIAGWCGNGDVVLGLNLSRLEFSPLDE